MNLGVGVEGHNLSQAAGDQSQRVISDSGGCVEGGRFLVTRGSRPELAVRNKSAHLYLGVF